MTPKDYFKAGEKHLNFCINLMNGNDNVVKYHDLLEIFYLAGYVAECFSIFVIYRFGGWNPTGYNHNPRKVIQDAMSRDIQEYFDPVFVYHTKFDFYHSQNQRQNIRKVGRLIKSVSTDKPNIQKGYHIHEASSVKFYVYKQIELKEVNFNFDLGFSECIDGNEIGTNDIKHNWYIAGHGFRDYIGHVINGQLASEAALGNIVFFSAFDNATEDSYKLLRKWNPEVRYYNGESKKENDLKESNLLTRKNLVELIDNLSYLFEQIKKI